MHYFKSLSGIYYIIQDSFDKYGKFLREGTTIQPSFSQWDTYMET